MRCDECHEDLLTNHADRDRGFIVCDGCGLVVDPTHEMGRGISGLMSWLRRYGVKKGDMQKITTLYVNDNLRAARLASIPIVESHLVRKI